ncbi:gmc oxidoreductase [Cystoisospora suis]|uniref:Gmc oxidoreductase n=1 Tax=Cystoisospora suis TaxID=483139 RepID=A0A2C6KQL8_9APIC|nr:gmc oxidoreductase [Cystoisospora suis]
MGGADAAEASATQPKRRTFRTFTYRGIELDKLLDMKMENLLELFRARQRRKFQRGIKRKATTLMKKLRISKKNCPVGEKPEPVKTHLRDLVVVPEMIGSVVGVYNGKQFINVEIKAATEEAASSASGDVGVDIFPATSGLDGGFQLGEAALIASLRLARKFVSYLNPLNWFFHLIGSDDSVLPPGSFCDRKAPLGKSCSVLFDHIVIGCGATGCPLARTLAEGGKKVLIIERGKERSWEKTPNAMTLEGAGRVIQDEDITQPIATFQGVRTHTANIFGGGTSINMAIVIEEEREYFDYLNKELGYNWDFDRVTEAYRWLSERSYFPMPQDKPFGKAWTKSLINRGYVPWIPSGRPYTGGPLPTGYRLRMGHVWGGGSLFNPDEGGFRMASDTLLGEDKGRIRSKNLTVLSEHSVQAIKFDRSGAVPRALCVDYRKTAFEDQTVMGINHTISTQFIGWKAVAYFLVKQAKAALNFYAKNDPDESKIMKRACVTTDDGEITLSAGAIHTPLLLMRSGIGSRKQLEEISIPIVKELPEVGKNLKDRMFIPLNFFTVVKNTSSRYHAARVCESIGIAKLGPDCKDFKIGDRSTKCTLAVAEELYGGNNTEGVILGTRYIFPPAFRHHPLVDKAFEIMTYCARHRPLVSHMREYLPICATIEPLINCFRRGSAPFYFTAEPKSTGFVALDKKGDVKVDVNYLKDEQDIFDAVRGLQNLLEAAKDPAWKGVLEPISLKGCPVQILNGVLDLVTRLGQDAIGEVFHGPDLRTIRFRQGDLTPGNRTVIPAEYDEANTQEQPPQAWVSDLEEIQDAEVTEENMVEYGEILEKIEAKQDAVEALLRRTQQDSPSDGTVNRDEESSFSHLDWNSIFSRLRKEFSKADGPTANGGEGEGKEGDMTCSQTCQDDSRVDGELKRCAMKDLYEQIYCKSGETLDSAPPSSMDDPQVFGRFWSNKLRPGSNSEQWLAAYPPILPRTDKPEEVAKFVFAFMTSLWHLHGTSKMGKVVDSEFKVIGVEGLSIADASVLTKLPRMNPTATLLMMGRYIGLERLGHWRKQKNTRKRSEELLSRASSSSSSPGAAASLTE